MSPPSTACRGRPPTRRWSPPRPSGCPSPSRRPCWESMRPGFGSVRWILDGITWRRSDPWMTSFVDCTPEHPGALLGLAPGRTGAWVTPVKVVEPDDDQLRKRVKACALEIQDRASGPGTGAVLPCENVNPQRRWGARTSKHSLPVWGPQQLVWESIGTRCLSTHHSPYIPRFATVLLAPKYIRSVHTPPMRAVSVRGVSRTSGYKPSYSASSAGGACSTSKIS
jgi:hypothetical protein